MKCIELFFLSLFLVCIHHVKSDLSLNDFVQISNVALDAPKEEWSGGSGKFACSDECVRRTNCRSFEVEDGRCYFSEYVSSDDYVFKPKQYRNFYQRIDQSQPFIAMRHASVPYVDIVDTKINMDYDQCQEHCFRFPRCRSFKVQLMCNGCDRYRCVFSTTDFLDAVIEADYDGWSIYLLNIFYNYSCSHPPPMDHAKLYYTETNLDAQAMYFCFQGYTVQTVCLRNGNWSEPSENCPEPRVSSCEEFKKCDGVKSDGEYWIYPKSLLGKRMKVYCDGMSTDNPKHYITLEKPTYFQVSVIKHLETCHDVGNNGRRLFNKVRLILREMALDLTDQRFTTFEPLIPGETMCFSKQNITIDLSGTGLTFGEDTNWATTGVSAVITSVQLLKDEQLAIIVCSGDCGTCETTSPFSILLFEGNDQMTISGRWAVGNTSFCSKSVGTCQSVQTSNIEALCL